MPEETQITMHRDKICQRSTDFIWGDFISTETCDALVDFYETQDMFWKVEGRTFHGNQMMVIPNIKESMDVGIPCQCKHPSVVNYFAELQVVLYKYIEKFPFSEFSAFSVREPISVQKYPKGGGFKTWHSERTQNDYTQNIRHLVYMTYLNDVPNGGTEWFHQDKYVEAQKGLTVIWPADWTHVHRGRVSHDHEKIVATGWFSYD